MTSPPATGGLLLDLDADAVAALVRTCPAVVRLTSGPFGAATYLPGRRVDGVRTTDDAVELHVAVPLGVTAAEVARQVRAALADRVGGRRVDVVVEDVLTPDEVAALDPVPPPTGPGALAHSPHAVEPSATP